MERARARSCKAISGVVRIAGGSIGFDGERIDGLGVEAIVRKRLVQVPEGRQLFGPLSVEENLQLGAYSRRRQGSPLSQAAGAGVRPVPAAGGAPGSAGGHSCQEVSSRCWRWLAP